MDLIERYVTAVGERLHPSRRPNVEAELRAAILDALHDRGGAAAVEGDVAAVLAELGDPERVAAGYEPERQFLIGPELYPLFRRGLRAGLMAIALAAAAGFGVSLMLGGLIDNRAGGLLMQTLWYALLAATVVVVVLLSVFAWLQYAEVRLPQRLRRTGAEWDPRSLPARRASDPASRLGALAGLVFTAVALVFVSAMGFATRQVLPNATGLVQPLLRDAISIVVMPLQVAGIVAAIAYGAALVKGLWQTWMRVLHVAADATMVFVFVRLSFLLLEHRAALVEAGVSRNVANWLVWNGFIIAAITAGIVAFHWWHVWRVSRAQRVTSSVRVASVVATALLLVQLPACVTATRVAGESAAPLSHDNVSPIAEPQDGATAGDLQRRDYESALFGESRELYVYTPPGYDARGARRYPVLYLLHGAGDGARAWARTGRVHLVIDSLLAARAAEPMIIVMPLGYGFPDAASRAGEMFSPATDQRAVMDAFAASLLDEIVPLIEREYRVRTDRQSRAIAGLSMGGSQALYIGLNRRDMFAHVASFGAAVIMYGGRYAEWFAGIAADGFHPQPRGDKARAQSLHMSVGTDDFLRGANRHFISWLNSHDATVQLDEVAGAHTWPVWRSEVTRLVPRLFREDSSTSLSFDLEIR